MRLAARDRGRAARGAGARGAERRLVSVLFADLVGFTTLSEPRDAEEVRELLSRYFETCSRLIGLYGGTVEKFIGDAVMAVWGTPTATEDDGERAVRAALDLVAAVSALGDEVGAPELRARAGVLTGEAAVTIGAEGQGMVAGDLVNTAARIQSAAEPGTVLVGDATRRSTEQTVIYENAGTHALKGKDEPDGAVAGASRRVRRARPAQVDGARGAVRRPRPRPPARQGSLPRVRREREGAPRLGDRHRGHRQVAALRGSSTSTSTGSRRRRTGTVAAASRTATVSRTGRSPTWCACAAGSARTTSPAVAREKLDRALEEHVPDAEERAFVEPRLAHLLGLTEHAARDKQDLFAAWRLFFERLADVYPTVLAFEDMQWADESLLDFVEYLLEWSRNSPIFVVTLARPELADRRPTWGAGLRNFTSLYLEPLPREAMEQLLAGLVPGLPEQLARADPRARRRACRSTRSRPCACCSTAACSCRTAPCTAPVGEIGDARGARDAARADRRAARRPVRGGAPRCSQDGAVLGKTFTRDGLRGALGARCRRDSSRCSRRSCARRCSRVQADPRSPEHGQYGFLQDLVRHVAYETLSRRERRTRHLAAAEYLRAAFPDEDEIVEVVAAHYVDAFEANPDAPDAAEVRRLAHETLVRAGDRAESLAAAREALAVPRPGRAS